MLRIRKENETSESYLFTNEQVERMIEHGIVSEDVELVNGFVYKLRKNYSDTNDRVNQFVNKAKQMGIVCIKDMAVRLNRETVLESLNFTGWDSEKQSERVERLLAKINKNEFDWSKALLVVADFDDESYRITGDDICLAALTMYIAPTVRQIIFAPKTDEQLFDLEQLFRGYNEKLYE